MPHQQDEKILALSMKELELTRKLKVRSMYVYTYVCTILCTVNVCKCGVL